MVPFSNEEEIDLVAFELLLNLTFQNINLFSKQVFHPYPSG